MTELLQADWSALTCKRNHRLRFVAARLIPWYCDLSVGDHFYGLSEKQERLTKEKYGIKRDENFSCLSNCTDHVQLQGQPAHVCNVCGFAVCEPCAGRALAALKHYSKLVRAINAAETVSWLRSKLQVVGEGGAGKTTFCNSLLGLEFEEKWESTVGAEIRQAKALVNSPWQEVAPGLQRDFAVQAGATSVNFEEEDPVQTPEDIAVLRGSEGTEQSVAKSTGIIDVPEVAGKFDLKLLLNAKESFDVVKFIIWDFGGQETFHSLHSLLLTKCGLYVVVFSLQQIENSPETTLSVIRFWLNSIRLHAKGAPVLLVGTFLDMLTTETTAVNLTLQTAFGENEQLVSNDANNLIFFPLSNKSGKGIEAIRSAIETVSLKQEFLRTQIKVKWLRCLDLMMEKGSQGWIALDKVKALASSCGIDSTKEVMIMLRLFHELGVLLHFDNTSVLCDKIILNPQWLISELTKLIRNRHLHPYNEEEITEIGLTQDYENLCNKALASMDFLTYLWDKHSIAFLIDILRRTLLLSDWLGDGIDNDKVFLVPSLLEDSATVEMTSPPMNVASCKFDFGDSFLPDGFFERLLCLWIDYTSSNKDAKVLEVRKSSLLVCYKSESATDKVWLLRNQEAVTLSVEPIQSCAKYLPIAKTIMRKVNEDIMGEGLHWQVFYISQSGDQTTEQNEQQNESSPWFSASVRKRHKTNQDTVSGIDLDSFLGML